MTAKKRPVSPHLQIYRLPLTALTSISHRISGVGLSVGSLVLVWWLVAAASGPESFASAQGLIGSVLGQLILLAWTFGLFFHMANGIRHLIWDAGFGFELKEVAAANSLVIAATVVLSVASWALAYALM